MKILKLKLFQETACYRKPFSTRPVDTYPLPPYSTVIGMLHKILDAKHGEVYDFDISIQGSYESCYNNFTQFRKFIGEKEKRFYKKKCGKDVDFVTKPLHNIELFNVNLILHIKGKDDVIDMLFNNIMNGTPIVLGRNHDTARLDYINTVEEVNTLEDTTEKILLPNSCYLKKDYCNYGINYRLSSYYHINKDNLRIFDKVDVKYVEQGTPVLKCTVDSEGDYIFFALN